MRNIYRLLWILSGLGVLGAILITYTEINDVVNMGNIDALTSITRDQFFYTSVGILFLTNILWYLLSRMLPLLPPTIIMVPARQYWVGSKYRYRKLKAILTNWMLSCGSVANYWLVVFFLGLRTPNSSDPDYRLLPVWYAYVGYVFLLLLILPFFRFFVQKLSMVFPEEE